SDGCGLRSSSARAVIIMPGVQKPHWRPCASMKPSCTGSSLPSRSRPSTVRTSWPSAITASVVHDLTGSPSTRTTQVPQFDVSHPQWVPVRPRVSRRKWTSRRRGSTSAERGSPLTVTVTCTVSYLLGQGALGGAAQGAVGELARQMALVVGAAALVGDRLAVGGGQARPLAERLLGGRLAAQG